MTGGSKRAKEQEFTFPVRDYRVIRFIPDGWKPLQWWGLDLFVWHIPVFKLMLALNVLFWWWAA